MFRNKKLPLGLKIALSFFLFGLFSLSILFLLLIPKIQQEQYENALNQTEKKVLLIKQQIKLIVEYFSEYGAFRKEDSKKEIINILDKVALKYSIDSSYNEKSIKEDLSKLFQNYNCNVDLEKNGKIKLDLKKQNQTIQVENPNNLHANKWHHFEDFHDLCPHPSTFFYKKIINDLQINLHCSSNFKSDNKNIEARVKKIMQEGFSLTQALHKGKVYLMWVNNTPKKEDLNKTLGELKNIQNENYCVSKISNFRTPKLGELTLRELLKVDNTKYILHKIDNKNSITFVSQIYENKHEKFIFVLSAYEEDFKNNLNSPILRILPLSIVALIVSIICGIFLFKKWIRNITKVAKTAQKVKNGNLNVRTNIKGSDEIAELGNTFDLMLDNLQDNISNLDNKIEERTKELKKTIDTKEILLKELNHRVKNNLYMIINLIKLQKSKVTKEDIEEALNIIENRIFTISLIHTKLFELRNFDSIDVKTYLSELIETITGTFNSTENVSIQKDISKCEIDVDLAMNCGLMINELITNSLKYAFSSSKENAEIEVSFKKEKDYYHLIFKDNGKGLQKDFDIENTQSLGLKLIYSISTSQLNGEFKIENKKGLAFFIKIPILR